MLERSRHSGVTLTLVLTLVSGVLSPGTGMSAPKPRLDLRSMKDWSIVVAASATEAEKYAAEEFRDFFAQATSYTLPILPASVAITKNVFIGASDSLKKSHVAHAMDREYKDEELRVIVTQENIAIVGGRPRGVLYGVYQFLEDAVGLRFLSPDYMYVPFYDPDDSYIRRKGNMFLADYSYSPQLVCRYPAFKGLPGGTGQFAARLRINGRWSGDPAPPAEWRQKTGGNNRNGSILHNIGKWMRVSVSPRLLMPMLPQRLVIRSSQFPKETYIVTTWKQATKMVSPRARKEGER
jgi:hypothetical protein